MDNDQSVWIRVPATADADQSAAKICVSLRQLQRRRGCSHVLLQDVLETMRPYLRCLGPGRYTDADKKLQTEAGVFCHELHGCVGCNNYVFPHDDKSLRCPNCLAARYADVTKKEPNEMIYYFPIAERMQALMQTKRFEHCANYELRRRSNDDFMTDLQDSPAWQKEMGPLPRAGKK